MKMKRFLTTAAMLLLLAGLLAACANSGTTTTATATTAQPIIGAGTTKPHESDPTSGIEPTDPSAGTEPTDPKVDPSTGIDPTDPKVDPSARIDPTDPTDPTDPSTDIEPTDPIDPDKGIHVTLESAQTWSGDFEDILRLQVTGDAAGWYTIDGNVTVTGYTVGKDMLIYLPEGNYEVLPAGAVAASVTLTPVEPPKGYTEDSAIAADGTEVKLYTGATLYFTYTASDDGVYAVAFGMNKTTESCCFTIDGETYSASVNRRLQAGDTLLIGVYSPERVSGIVSMIVTQKFEEELPAEGWISGTYMNGSMRLELDREEKTVKFMGQDAVRFYYLDGEAAFTSGDNSVIMSMNENCIDIDIKLTTSDDPENPKEYTLVYRAPVDPIGIEKFEGVYLSASGDKIIIAADGSGIGFNTRFNIGEGGCSYDAEWNVLQWGAYEIGIYQLDGNGMVHIIIIGETKYTATSHAKVTLPDENLPISSNKYLRYVSKATAASIDIYDNGTQYINGRGFTVLDITADGAYVVYGYFKQTVADSGDISWQQAKWTLKFSGESIYFYDESGKQCDVLSVEKIVARIGELPVSAIATDVPKVDADVNGYYFLKVTQSGYYNFRESASSADIYRNCTENGDDYPIIDYTTRVKVDDGGVTLELKAGEILGFYGGDGAGGSRTLTVSYMEKLPQGYSAEDPYTMSGTYLDLSSHVSKDTIYVCFTAEKPGNYTIGFNNKFVAFTVDGTTYGYDYANFEEYAAGTTCKVKLTKGASVLIAIKRHFDNGESFVLGVAPSGTKLDKIFDSLIEYAAFTSNEQGIYEGGSTSEMHFVITVNATTVDTVISAINENGKTVESTTKGATVEVRNGKYVVKDVKTPYGEIDISFTISGNVLNLTVDGTESYSLYRQGTQPGGTEVELGNVCAAVAGSYVCVDNESIVFVLSDSMVVNNYSIGATTGAALQENNGVYTFSYAQGTITVTVTFYDNGYIVINDSVYGEYILVRTEN